MNGDRTRYRLQPAPLGQGGQAAVFEAIDKTTDEAVAFKRRTSKRSTAVRRMRREIEVQAALDHPHIVPVLDAAEDHSWFVMPLADGSLADTADQLGDEEIRDMLTQVADGLDHAHQQGHVHRDVTPNNILYFEREDGRRIWQVGDWGLVRRPRGQTSATLTRSTIGTDGYVAPEAWTDPHGVGAAADVYSLGVVAAYVLTGTDPAPQGPDLPIGPWRSFLRRATHRDPSRRIPDMTTFRTELQGVVTSIPPTPKQQRGELADRARRGDGQAAVDLFEMTLANPDDDELHLDLVVGLPADFVRRLVARRPDDALAVVERIGHHLRHSFGDRNFNSANRPLSAMLTVARAAQQLRDVDLLEDIADVLLAANAEWDRYAQYRPIRSWLAGLDETMQHPVAAALRRDPRAVDWLVDYVDVDLDDTPILYAAVNSAGVR